MDQHLIAMNLNALLLITCLVPSTVFHVPLLFPDLAVVAKPVGGPPAIRISGKAGGELRAAEWRDLKRVELVGCMPGARIVSYAVRLRDCTGKDTGLQATGAVISDAVRSMVANLPPGMEFTVIVTALDDGGRSLAVAPARYVWRG